MNDNGTGKICTKCQQFKLFVDFYSRPKTKDGYRNDCKVCHNQQNADYRANNLDKVKTQQKIYRLANREKKIKQSSDWYYNNKDKARAINTNYRTSNPRKVKNARMLASYGITLDEFEQMLKSQNDKCAICCKAVDRNGWACIDHNHNTGKVRGVLCSGCNKGIGFFEDNPEMCELAAKYLRTHA